MNRLSIQQEIENLRFNTDTTKAAQILNWINLAEAELWESADWNFKRVPVANLTVVSGVATMSGVPDFSKGIALYDPSGVPLVLMRPDDFEAAFRVGNPTTGTLPYAWTVINRQIYVGPAVSGTFKLAYRRRVFHYNNTDTLQTGVMANDTDKPFMDSEFHYILVPWAMIIGMKLENDPTNQILVDMRDGLLRRMMDEHVGGVEKQVEFWGDPMPWYYR